MIILEAGMLLCFGASWPVAVYKTYTTKSVEGKSSLFLLLILLGYACGMLNKVLSNFDAVFYLYVLNFILVFADLVLYLKYRKPNSPIEPVVK